MKEEMPLIKPIGVGTPLYLLIAISSCITTYTGTCIVLSILAIVFRFLVAFRSVLERQRIDIEIKSRDSIYVRKPIVDTRIDRVLLTRGIKGNGVVVRRDVDRIGSWRRTFDGPRAVIDSLIVSTIYFLTLFLVTMDMGYLLAILCGTIFGSLAVRKYGGEAVCKETRLFVVAMIMAVLAFD